MQELRGYQVNQDQPAQPDRPALRERLGQPDRPALKVMQDLQARRASKAPEARRALKGQRGLGVRLEQLDQQARRAPRARRGIPAGRADLRGLEALREYPAYRDLREKRAPWERRVTRVIWVTRVDLREIGELRDPLDPKGPLEHAVKRATPDRRDRRVSRANPEPRGPLEPVLRDQRATQETKDRQGRRARKDLWAPLGHRDQQGCAARQAPRESRDRTAPRVCRASREFLNFKL